MSKPMFVKFETPAELAESALKALERARQGGKIRKGINETIKAVERGSAALVYIAEDTTPPEIVAHLPIICEERKIPYIYIKSKTDLGAAVGIQVSSAAAAIVKTGEAEKNIKDIIKKLETLKKA